MIQRGGVLVISRASGRHIVEHDPVPYRILWFVALAAGAIILWRVVRRRYPNDE